MTTVLDQNLIAGVIYNFIGISNARIIVRYCHNSVQITEVVVLKIKIILERCVKQMILFMILHDSV